MLAISDTSPFIALHSIGRLGLLPQLFDTIMVPAAVAGELKSIPLPGWVRTASVPQGGIPLVTKAGRGRGETEAIRLALHLRPDRLLLDDEAGRREARRLGLRVMGVLGVLVAAKRVGLLSRRFARRGPVADNRIPCLGGPLQGTPRSLWGDLRGKAL